MEVYSSGEGVELLHARNGRKRESKISTVLLSCGKLLAKRGSFKLSIEERTVCSRLPYCSAVYSVHFMHVVCDLGCRLNSELYEL